MANTIDNTIDKITNTLDKVGNVVQDIFKGKDEVEPPIHKNGKMATCLENIAMKSRKEHLMKNEWKKDLSIYNKMGH